MHRVFNANVIRLTLNFDDYDVVYLF